MKLLFRQRFFSWFDSYDIYDENQNVVFTVKGKLSWGHLLEIYNANGIQIGTVKEEVLTFLPRFTFYIGDKEIGCLRKELTFFKPSFNLDCNGWKILGDIMQWEYRVSDTNGNAVMTACKEVFNLTDTYTLSINRQEDALLCLMIVIAIDASKCSTVND